MKKIISFLMASALLLGAFIGVTSCSGDLHDDKAEYHLLYIAGDLQGLMPNGDTGNTGKRTAMTPESGNIVKFTFTYDSAIHNKWHDVNKPAEGIGDLSVKFCLAEGDGDWNNQNDFGWDNDDNTGFVMTVDYQEIFKRGSSRAPTNPGNLNIKGLVEGNTYTIYADFDSAAGTCKVKIDGLGAGGGGGGVKPKPTPFPLTGYAVLGISSTNQWVPAFGDTLCSNGSLDVVSGETVYTFTFKLAGTEFGVVGASNWNPCYADAEVGSDWTELKLCTNGDNKATFASALSLSIGNACELQIKTTPDQKVYAKARKVALAKLHFKVTGIDASVTKIYLNGSGVGGWGDWPQGKSGDDYTAFCNVNTSKIADVVSGEATISYTADVVGDPGSEYQIQNFKVIGIFDGLDKDWADTPYDGDNDGTIFPKITSLADGDYTVTVDLTNMDKTGKKDGVKQKYDVTVAKNP